MNPREISLDDCRVVVTSPAQYEECVVEVETTEELLFILSDEQRSGSCIVELPGDGDAIVRRVSLECQRGSAPLSVRALLDAAERRLLGHE